MTAVQAHTCIRTMLYILHIQKCKHIIIGLSSQTLQTKRVRAAKVYIYARSRTVNPTHGDPIGITAAEYPYGVFSTANPIWSANAQYILVHARFGLRYYMLLHHIIYTSKNQNENIELILCIIMYIGSVIYNTAVHPYACTHEEIQRKRERARDNFI